MSDDFNATPLSKLDAMSGAGPKNSQQTMTPPQYSPDVPIQAALPPPPQPSSFGSPSPQQQHYYHTPPQPVYYAPPPPPLYSHDDHHVTTAADTSISEPSAKQPFFRRVFLTKIFFVALAIIAGAILFLLPKLQASLPSLFVTYTPMGPSSRIPASGAIVFGTIVSTCVSLASEFT